MVELLLCISDLQYCFSGQNEKQEIGNVAYFAGPWKMFTLLPLLSVHDWAFKNSKSLNNEINMHPKERSLDLLWVSEVLYCIHKVARKPYTVTHPGSQVGSSFSQKNGFLGPKQNWKSNFILNRTTVRLKKGLLDLRNSDFVSLADSITVSQILNVNRQMHLRTKTSPKSIFHQKPPVGFRV